MSCKKWIRWTAEELEFLRSNYSKMTLNELSSALNRDKDTIKVKACSLKIKKHINTKILSLSERDKRRLNVKKLIQNKPVKFDSELDRCLYEINKSNNKYHISNK